MEHAYMDTHIRVATWIHSSYAKVDDIWITNYNVITNNEHCQLTTIYSSYPDV